VLDGIAFPSDHQQRGQNKSDFLSFRLKVAQQLIVGLSSRKKAGCSRSAELTRLNPLLGHWPARVDDKRDGVVCTNVCTKKGAHTKLTEI